ncbi:MAG TPA: hypothetical protein DDX71_04765 [Ruminococcus sp.]|nr:hypothetical protein [Ruminococcus sp.]
MKYLKKLFGGIEMTWLRVIGFAVISAVWSAVLLLLPVDLDVAGMGSTYPWWILFALIIITNCEKPLEAACKTFVFFLISQPLIYIFQAPFSELGLRLLRYYPPWFIMTLLTFPGAWLGWQVRKPGILSGVILSPMLYLITMIGYDYLPRGILAFPHNLISLVSGIFCAAEYVLLLIVILHENKQRIAAICATILLIAGTFLILLIMKPSVCGTVKPLPESISAEDIAEIAVADPKLFRVQLSEKTPDDPKTYLQIDALKEECSTEAVLYGTDGQVLKRYQLVCVRKKDDNPANEYGYYVAIEITETDDP